MSEWNAKTIAEFRANEGRIGAYFEGAPVVLRHHRGRKSGRERVTPVMYLRHETNPDIVHVFATKSGAPTNPAWYTISPPPVTAASNAEPRRTSDRPRIERR